MMRVPRPRPTAGMHHVALHATAFDACLDFYTRLLGMHIEWQPDPDNYYLTSGTDNVALHRATGTPVGRQRLDHIGFILNNPQDVDDWYVFLQSEHVEMLSEPRTHRDGARSFYCTDPEGTTVQFIFHPPLSRAEQQPDL